MKRRILLTATTLILAGAILPAWADYDKAQDLYKQGKYEDAAREYEADLGSHPRHAMAYYKLGLTYGHLNRHADAVKAYESALALDPNLAGKTKINDLLAKSRAKAGSGGAGTSGQPARPNGASRPTSQHGTTTQTTTQARSQTSGANTMINALESDVLYVAPAMTAKVDDATAAAIRSKLKGYNPPIKAAIVTEAMVMKQARSLPAYTHALHEYLRMPAGGALMVATEKGVAAEGGNLGASTMAQAVKDALPAFAQGYEPGLSKLATGIDAHRRSKKNTSTGIWFFILLAIAGVAVLIWLNAKRKKAAARAEVQTLMGRFTDKMTSVSDDLQFFARDPKAKDANRLFDEATAIYQKVDKQFAENPGTDAYQGMAASMQQALRKLDQSGVMLKALLEGKEPPAAVEDEPAAPSGPGGSGAATPDIGPDTGCFFCSRPTNPRDGEIVELQREGRMVKVLACPQCAGQYDRGQMPQVVGYNRGGVFTPWYQVPDYRYGQGGMSVMDYWMLERLFDDDYEYRHHHHNWGSHRYHDDYETRMDRATEGTLSDYSSSRGADTGEAAGGSFWGSSGSSDSGSSASGGFFGSDQS